MFSEDELSELLLLFFSLASLKEEVFVALLVPARPTVTIWEVSMEASTLLWLLLLVVLVFVGAMRRDVSGAGAVVVVLGGALKLKKNCEAFAA